MNAVIRVTLAATLAAALGGCACPPEPEYRASVEELVERYNANASALPRLWARATIELHLVGEEGTMHWGSMLSAPNGLLLLSKGPDPTGPHDLVLIGKELGREIFRLGNSLADAVYYYWYQVGDNAGGAFGRTELAGAPGIEGMPVNPMHLLSVLAVGELPGDLTRVPAVTLSFDQQDCRRYYVLHHLSRQAVTDRINMDRLIYMPWSDDQPPRPERIDFLDADGVRRIRATLGRWREVEMLDVPEHSGPPAEVPTQIHIEWLDTGSFLRMRLGELTTADKFDPAVFELWNRLPGEMPAGAIRPVHGAQQPGELP